MGSPMRWAYGVTTHPSRRKRLLPRTLASLAAGGFPKPRLFIDGVTCADGHSYEQEFRLEVTCRWPHMRTFANWLMGLAELYMREPGADRYAMFQDDLVCCVNLRQYLERCRYEEKTYWNLLTFPENQALCLKASDSSPLVGWYPSNQKGKGAVGLVFSRPAVLALLTNQEPKKAHRLSGIEAGAVNTYMLERPMSAGRGHKVVDGGVVSALKLAGYREMVHNPSLVLHTGELSTLGHPRFPDAPSFRGENFDALGLLPGG